MTRWHYHKDAGDVTIVGPIRPWPETSTLRLLLAPLEPLCKTKGYELYLTACVLHVSCRRCLHLMKETS